MGWRRVEREGGGGRETGRERGRETGRERERGGRRVERGEWKEEGNG